MIEKILKSIDDIYILKQRHVSNAIKLLALSKKHGKDLRNELVFEDGALKYAGRVMINLKYDKNILYWRILDIKNGFLHVEGKDNCWVDRNKYYYFCETAGEIYFPEYKDYIHYNLNSLYGIIIKGRTVSFKIPLENNMRQTIRFYIDYMGNKTEIFPTLDWFSHIPPIPEGYYISENFIIKNEERRLNIYPYTNELEISFEQKYCEQLKLNGKEYLIKYRVENKKYKSLNLNNKKEIWLINDRLNQAGDNGEYFFRYINENKKNEIDSYFILLENCTDFKRIKNIGNVIPFGSEKHLNKFLMADKIISSMCNSWVDNPFGEDRLYIYDLFHFDYIFLQHGISKDDVSHYFHKLNKNFTMIITAAKKEYLSLMSPNYGYNESNIKLTGFARYDNLQHLKSTKKTEKIILIIPTWRMSIKGTIDPLTSKSVYSKFFKATQYFEFYNSLINNQKLLEAMKKLNYTGYFCLHPAFASQWIDFDKNPQFIIKETFDYQEVIAKASLLVTDYSSVFFDFAYMGKPIIYSQFDYEEYRENQYQNGYFDYQRDGFGPVFTDVENTVNGIIEYINNGCTLKNKYLRRIQTFFSFFDENNCERIYKEIYAISHNKKKNLWEDVSRYIYAFIIIIICCFKLDNLMNERFDEEKDY